MKTALDEKYGVGITDFFVKALDEFYKNDQLHEEWHDGP